MRYLSILSVIHQWVIVSLHLLVYLSANFLLYDEVFSKADVVDWPFFRLAVKDIRCRTRQRESEENLAIHYIHHGNSPFQVGNDFIYRFESKKL